MASHESALRHTAYRYFDRFRCLHSTQPLSDFKFSRRQDEGLSKGELSFWRRWKELQPPKGFLGWKKSYPSSGRSSEWLHYVDFCEAVYEKWWGWEMDLKDASSIYYFFFENEFVGCLASWLSSTDWSVHNLISDSPPPTIVFRSPVSQDRARHPIIDLHCTNTRLREKVQRQAD